MSELSQSEKMSYALGVDVGQSFKRLPIDVNINILIDGLKDAFEGNKIKISQEDFQTTMQQLQEKMKVEGEKIQKNAGVINIKEGKEYLEKNEKKDEVIVTKSGLQYEILVEGTGKKPTADDTVSVHYTGALINGTEFDSSVRRGTPATFPVKGVIPGWTEALQLMNVGSKLKLYIPSELAYGVQGAGQDIGPNATLIFEVELLEIK